MRPLSLRNEKALALCLTAVFLAVCLYLSLHNMMWMDEFLALNLIQDTSWSHMMQSWAVGADSGGLFFYVLSRLMVAATGSATLTVRLCSTLCFAAAGLLWYSMLRERFHRGIAAFAVLAMWLGTPLVQGLAVQVRFYGLLMLTFSVAVFAMDRLTRPRMQSPMTVAALALLTHALLLSSHMLGLIYSAEILFAALFATAPLRRRAEYVTGGLASWLLLLVYLPAVHGGAAKLNWIPMPHLVDVARFHIQEPFAIHSLNALLVLLVGLAISTTLARAIKGTTTLTALPVLAIVLAFTPVMFAIISHLYRPIVADRYLVPCLAGLAYLLCATVTVLREYARSTALRTVAAVAGSVLVAVLYGTALRQARYEPTSSLRALENWPSEAPIAIADHSVFEQLEFYDRAHRDRYAYLLPQNFRTQSDTSILSTVWQQGYVHNFAGIDEFTARYPRFLYAQFPSDQGLFAELVGRNRSLCYRQMATVSYGSQAVPMLEVWRPAKAGTCDAQALPTSISATP